MIYASCSTGIFTGANGKRMRLASQEENPGQVVTLRVNGRYPDTIPFSNMPPQVLRNAAASAGELEYRFIGRTLILLDTLAHIIVDYITGRCRADTGLTMRTRRFS